MMSKIRTPFFRYYEGKYRERNRIVDHFPNRGQLYLEPFAGSGNVYYEFKRRKPKFDGYWLNDCQPFLQNLEICKMGQFPVVADRETYDKWAATDTPESDVLARAITYNGWGYWAGFIGEQSYNRDSLLESVFLAQPMLKTVTITCMSWDEIDYTGFTEADFLYFDPPTRKSTQPRISEYHLVELLHSAKFRWALTHPSDSWYNNELTRFKHTLISNKLYLWKNF
jgi:site-specific DNA-adenine methylase